MSMTKKWMKIMIMVTAISIMVMPTTMKTIIWMTDRYTEFFLKANTGHLKPLSLTTKYITNYMYIALK